MLFEKSASEFKHLILKFCYLYSSSRPMKSSPCFPYHANFRPGNTMLRCILRPIFGASYMISNLWLGPSPILLLSAHFFHSEDKTSISYFHVTSDLVNEYCLTGIRFSSHLNNPLVMGKQDDLIPPSQVSHGFERCP